MKKFVTLLLVTAGITGTSFAQNTHDADFVSRKVVLGQNVYSLIVNDDVNIVFTDEAGSEITVEGRTSEVEKVILTEHNGKLEISAPSNFMQKKKAVVYVPARGLRSVTVNGASVIYSYDKIQNPHMNVFVNGTCQLTIRTYGKVKVISSDEFSTSYQTKKISE